MLLHSYCNKRTTCSHGLFLLTAESTGLYRATQAMQLKVLVNSYCTTLAVGSCGAGTTDGVIASDVEASCGGPVIVNSS